jgi:SNF2 family DNA or RNA helicase
MAMRRAAFRAGADSAKMQRVVDIVEELKANEWKVVFFSFFRDVLTEAAAVLGDQVVGTLTGSVPPAKRQELVDRF